LDAGSETAGTADADLSSVSRAGNMMSIMRVFMFHLLDQSFSNRLQVLCVHQLMRIIFAAAV
jgi:hypothetical protein